MSDTPITDKLALRDDNELKNDLFNLARDLERVAQQMAGSLLLDEPFRQSALATWRAFEEKYRERG